MIVKTSAKTLLLAGLLAAASPAFAQHDPYWHDSSFRVRAGLFTPDLKSSYWDDNRSLFTGDPKDIKSSFGGLDYRWGLGRHVGLLFSLDGFSGDTTQSYRGFVDDRGDRIRHSTKLDLSSATAGVVFELAPDAAVRPYVGAGGGLYSWQLRERGDFIDVNSPHLDIFTATLKSDGVTAGGYVLAGIDVPVSPHVSFFGEGKWSHAKDTLDRDFEGFGKIDLSGTQVAAGISWNF